MDDSQFDRLARALSERLSRRGVGRLGGGALAALATTVGAIADMEAGKKGKKKKKDKDKKPSCRRQNQTCADSQDCCAGLTCDDDGVCRTCRTPGQTCDAAANGAPCCNGSVCDGSGHCQACRRRNETCGGSIAAPCCNGLTCDSSGRCQQCRVSGQRCGDGLGNGVP
jgi:hypothetical protein